MAGFQAKHHSRFSFSTTDISELDIEWLLENNVSLAQLLPQADDHSPPPSPIDGAFDDLPALSPSTTPSSLPSFHSSPLPESLDTPRATRKDTLSRSQMSEIPLSLASYSFPSPSPSPSRSSTPTPMIPHHPPHSILPTFILPATSRSTKHDSTGSSIMVELDEFFPRPSDTFSPFPTFSSISSTTSPASTSDPLLDLPPPRKGSLASSFFSTSSSSSSNSSCDDVASIRSRNRSRTVSNKSDKGGGGRGGGGGSIRDGFEVRQPKLAAYPRYVAPKPAKPDSGEGKKSRLFGR